MTDQPLSDRLRAAAPTIDAMIETSTWSEISSIRTNRTTRATRSRTLVLAVGVAIAGLAGGAIVVGRNTLREVDVAAHPMVAANDPSDRYTYLPTTARQSNTITGIRDLVKTSDSVALVTVLDERRDRSSSAEGARTEQRFLTLQIDQTLTGGSLPAQVELYESMTSISPTGSRSTTNTWNIEVGDQLVVALSEQPHGPYEFNGDLAFFPYGDPEAAATVAAGRIESRSPAAKNIGSATAGLSGDKLLAVFTSQ